MYLFSAAEINTASFTGTLLFPQLLSCHALKLGMGSEQDARTTRILPFLTLWFKCRTAY